MITLDVYKGKVLLIETLKEAEEYFNSLDPSEVLTFDWETDGLHYNTLPLGLALHQQGVHPAFIPFDHYFTKGLPTDTLTQLLNEQFKRFNLIAHNAKFDSMVNVMNGIKDENCNIIADTLIMIHLYDPSIEKKLETRVKKDFKYEKKTFDEICGKKWAKVNWSTEGDELLPLLASYAGEDTYWETQMYYKYKDLLDEDTWRVHNRIELPMIKILRDAKIRGVQIDVGMLREMGSRVLPMMENYVEDIYTEAGTVFNLNSPKQKQEVFFEKMGLPIISRTKTGAASTDSGSAKEWAEMGYPIGEYLVRYSELNKLNSGYIQAIPNLCDEEGVLRGDVNSCGTETGRCSSSNPNLQNQPNNHSFPIRNTFIPRPGYVFINYDYSQLELRVMAHMSGDKLFTEVFNKGEDPHGDVAKRLGISRKGAKVVNFGVLYGMGPDKLAATLGIPEADAQRIIQVDFMKAYSGFAKWKESTEMFVRKNGYVKNLFGRMRRLPDATKPPMGGSKKNYFSALRKSVNTIIQGTGADIVKLATIAMCKEFEEKNLPAYFLLQVHDEVLIEVREDIMLEAEEIVLRCMRDTVKLNIPLDVDGKILRSWGEAKDEGTLSVPKRFDYSLISSLM